MALWGQSSAPHPREILLGATGEQGSKNFGLLSGSSGLRYNREGPAPFEKGLSSGGHFGKEQGKRHCFLQSLE